jgi:hypothetical protein
MLPAGSTIDFILPAIETDQADDDLGGGGSKTCTWNVAGFCQRLAAPFEGEAGFVCLDSLAIPNFPPHSKFPAKLAIVWGRP